MANNTLDPNPFSTRIYAKQGNQVAKDIFSSVGYALSEWEQCETSFAALYTIFVKPTGGTHTAFRAYGAVMSSGSRRDMIAAAAEAFFATFPDNALPERVSALLKLYQDAAGRRNDIAHAVVMSEPLVVGASPIYFLIPSFHASRKTGVMPPFETKYRYSTVEIDRYASCFGALGLEAGKVKQAVSSFYQSLPETLRAQFP
jgi:hypothetical protein